jgi:predicted RNA binding protein YcfA (HicA-like mRNA interferase family)
MARVPPRSTREVEQVLRHFGLRRLRRHGGHDVWGPGAPNRNVSVPRARGSGTLPSGTVTQILYDAGIPVADALAFWGIQPR